MRECQYCSTAVGLFDSKCPNCGANLPGNSLKKTFRNLGRRFSNRLVLLRNITILAFVGGLASVAIVHFPGLLSSWYPDWFHRLKRIELHFNSLPSEQGWEYYLVGNNVPETSIFSLKNGVLCQDSIGTGFSGSSSNCYILPGVVDPELPFCVEIRARVIKEEHTIRYPFGLSVLIHSGKECWGFGIGSGEVRDIHGQFLAAVDHTEFHNFRLEGFPGDRCFFYLDGKFMNTGLPLLASVTNKITLGDGTGASNACGEVTSYLFWQSSSLAKASFSGK